MTKMFFTLADAKAFLKANGFTKLAGASYIDAAGALATICNKGRDGVYVDVLFA